MRRESEKPVLGYTVKEAAKALRIGLNQAYAGVKSGDIPSLKIGKRIIVPVSALNKRLEDAGA